MCFQITSQPEHALFSEAFRHYQSKQLSNDFLCPIAEDVFRTTVERADHPIRCNGYDRIGSCVYDGAVACFAFS